MHVRRVAFVVAVPGLFVPAAEFVEGAVGFVAGRFVIAGRIVDPRQLQRQGDVSQDVPPRQQMRVLKHVRDARRTRGRDLPARRELAHGFHGDVEQ